MEVKAEVDNPRNGKDCQQSLPAARGLGHSPASEGANLRMSSDFEPLLVGPPCLSDIVPMVWGTGKRGLERREDEGFSWSLINYKMSMEHLGRFRWVPDNQSLQFNRAPD